MTDFGTVVIMTIPDGFGPASEVSSQYKSHLFLVDAEDRSLLGTFTNGRIPRWGGTKFLVRHLNIHIGIKFTYLVLAPDTIQVGSVRTRSSDTLVTDSAASATAYSCAIKVGGQICCMHVPHMLPFPDL